MRRLVHVRRTSPADQRSDAIARRARGHRDAQRSGILVSSTTRPAPAKRYKQFLITLSVIYPLTMLVPWAYQWLLGSIPGFANYWVAHLIAAATVVGLMAYLIMPRYTRLLAKWLYT